MPLPGWSRPTIAVVSLGLAACDGSAVRVTAVPPPGWTPSPSRETPAELDAESKLRLFRLRGAVDAKPWEAEKKQTVQKVLSDGVVRLLEDGVAGAEILTLTETLLQAQGEPPLVALGVLAHSGRAALESVQAWHTAQAAWPGERASLEALLARTEEPALQTAVKALLSAALQGGAPFVTLANSLVKGPPSAMNLALAEAVAQRLAAGASVADVQAMADQFRSLTSEEAPTVERIRTWGSAPLAAPQLSLPAAQSIWKAVAEQTVVPSVSGASAGLFEVLSDSTCNLHGEVSVNALSGETLFSPASGWTGSCTVHLRLRDRETGNAEATTVVAVEEPLRLNSLALDGTSPTRATTLSFTATFNSSVQGLLPEHFTLGAQAPSGARVTTVSGSGAVFTVTVNTGSGNGSLQLGLRDTNVIVSTAELPLGGPLAGDGDFVSLVPIIVDKTAPEATFSSTTATLTAAATAAIAGQGEPGSTVILATHPSCSSPQATLTLGEDGAISTNISLAENANTTLFYSASDAAGNLVSCRATGLVFTRDTVAPSVNGTVTSNPVSPANANSITLSGLTEARATALLFDDTLCAHQVGQATAGSNGIFSIATSVADNSTTDFRIRVRDSVGNQSSCPASAHLRFVEDSAFPTEAISAPSLSLINSAGSVSYTVTYTAAESVSLSSGDITLNVTGTASCIKSVLGSGTATRTVTLSNCSGDGTLGITLAAGTSSDAAGNSSLGAGPSASFTVDNTAPTLTIGAPSYSSANSSRSVAYTVTYSGASTVTLGDPDITIQTTGTANCAGKSVSGSGNSARTVTLSACTGDGTAGISIAAATATDALANSAAAAGPSTSFVVDNSPPSVAITAPNGGSDMFSSATSHTFSGTCSTDTSTITMNNGVTMSDNDCSNGDWASTSKAFGWENTTYTATATDAAGNTATDAITLTKQVAVGQPDQNTVETNRTLGTMHFIWTDNTKMAISDTICGRILLWNSLPSTSTQPPDVVLGVPSYDVCSANFGGVSASSLSSPRHVYSDGTKLYVTDAGNHRVLIWNSWPTTHNQPADVVVGQTNFTNNTANGGNAGPSESTLSTPYSARPHGTKFVITDYGNNRVLIFNAIPSTNGASANTVLGQTDMASNTANSGGPSASSLRGPINTESVGSKFLIADGLNGRTLIFDPFPTSDYAAASVVVGRPDFATATASTTQATFWSIHSIHSDGTRLFATDYHNNRVLVWSAIPSANGTAADFVLGQPHWTAQAPNNGGSAAQNLTYPFGVFSAAGTLYVGDGNGRTLKYPTASLTNNLAATGVIGRAALSDVATYAGLSVGQASVYGVERVGNKFAIADGANHRILLWNQAPKTAMDLPDVVLGQPDLVSILANAGGSVSASSLNGAYGMTLVGDGSSSTKVIVADSANNRVLIWNTWPTAHNQAADVVLGQTDKITGSGGTTSIKMSAPRQVWSDGTKLIVADYGNRRLLGWDSFPTADGTPAQWVIGQSSWTTATSGCAANRISLALGVWSNGNRIFLTDYSNHRILVWNSWPAAGTTDPAADIVLGQANATTCIANRGGSVAADTLNYPYYLHGDSTGRLYVADYGNKRLLIWNSLPTANGTPADIALGQPDLTTNSVVNDANKQRGYSPLSVSSWTDGTLTRLYVGNYSGTNTAMAWNRIPSQSGTPYDAALGGVLRVDTKGVRPTWFNGSWDAVIVGSKLAVADQSNNRILVWNSIPSSDGVAPDVVLGQTDFVSGLPNRGVATPTAETLWGPGGLATDGTRLLVADLYNNRVLIWNSVPTVSGIPADVVIGHSDFSSNYPCPTGVSASCLNNPTTLAFAAGKLVVNDRGNHRVLVYNEIPAANGVSADLVLGQNTMTTSFPGTTASTFRMPNWLDSDGNTLAVADYNNNRALVWTSFPTTSGQAADVVLGQPDMVSNGTNPFGAGNAANLTTANLAAVFGGKIWIYDANELGIKYWSESGLTSGSAPAGLLGRAMGSAVAVPSATGMAPQGHLRQSGGLYLIPDQTYRRVLIRASSP